MSDLQVQMAEDVVPPSIVEKAVLMGDLSKLQPIERLEYYRAVCQSLGLNPLTRPFQYIKLNHALTLYATKDATDQLRSLRGIAITKAERDMSDPLYAVWVVTGQDRNGRSDIDIGSVSIGKLTGEAKANAIMKALTKAKRRLTLSLAGMGNFLDESEVNEHDVVEVDYTTGEVIAAPDGEDGSITAAQNLLRSRARAGRQQPQAVEPDPVPIPDSEAPQKPSEEPTGTNPSCMAEPADEALGMKALCTKPKGHRGAHRSDEGTWPA